jgi:2-dehydro-3-deoxy-D-arabinonate dehydratase
MQLAKYRSSSGDVCVGSVDGDQLWPVVLEGSPFDCLASILETAEPGRTAESLIDRAAGAVPCRQVSLLAPIDRQEVWAAGVTYKRSRSARVEESDVAAVCYSRVYESERPELFLKATPHRVSGPGQALAIRSDSKWNVPEPELTLVLNSRKQLVGFTAGNDMSSRDIEGENPLYLPQAKVYDACCGLGPVITLKESMPLASAIEIRMVVRRDGQTVFEGATSVRQMARTFDELIDWLSRANSFPGGALLMTGTGVVPNRHFSLQPGDQVDITIDGIGTLSNPVVRVGAEGNRGG